MFLDFGRGIPSRSNSERTIALWRAISLPSLRAQTVPFDFWVIHSPTDGELLDAVRSDWPTVRFVQVDGESHSAAIRRAMTGLSGDVLTIRLDSDDAIAPDFVERLAALARPGVNYFARDYQWDLEGRRVTIREAREPTTFSSLLESGNYRSVLYIGHRSLGDRFPVNRISIAAPLTLQVIHGANLRTRRATLTKKRCSNGTAIVHSFGVTSAVRDAANVP